MVNFLSKTPRFNSDSVKWLPQKPDIPEIERWLEGDYSLSRRVKHNSKRSVYALYPAPQAAPSCYLKYDHPNEAWDALRSWMRPKVLGEFRSLALLQSKGVAAVLPVSCGWMFGHGILLTRALNNSRTMEELWLQISENDERRKKLLSGLSALLQELFSAEIFHPDLHFGNILAVEEDKITRCALVDVHGVKAKRKLSFARQMAMLRMLSGLARDLRQNEIVTLLQPLFPEGDFKYLGKIWQEINKSAVRQMRRKWPDRRRKILNSNGRSNSFCAIATESEGVWRWRAGFDLALARDIVKNYRNKTSAEAVNQNSIRKIFRVKAGGRSFIVKEFINRNRDKQNSAACISWLSNWRLENSGFPAPRYLAWFQPKKGNSYLVSEIIEGVSLFEELKKVADTEAAINILFGELLKLLSGLYSWGIFHEEINAKNIMVCEEKGKPRLYLADNDRVRFDRKTENELWQRHYGRLRETLPEVSSLHQRFDSFFAQSPDLPAAH